MSGDSAPAAEVKAGHNGADGQSAQQPPPQQQVVAGDTLNMPRIVLHVENPLGKTVVIDATPTDCLMDIRQFLLETPESCYFTCYSLQHEGKPINDFAELAEYPELKEDRINNLKMIPGFYDESSARTHVRRLREILVNPPVHVTQKTNPYVSDPGELKKEAPGAGNSASAGAGASKGPAPPPGANTKKDGKKRNPEKAAAAGAGAAAGGGSAFDVTAYPEATRPQREKVPEVVRNINFSAWNPPPGNRRLRGDILYLEVATLEKNTLHVTCSVNGFFLNRSTRDRFDPFPAATAYTSHTLVELLKKASHSFSSKFSRLMTRRMTRHPYEVIMRPFPVHEWMARAGPHAYDWNRAEDSLLTTYGMEGGRGVLRDWNEEYQCCHEMPRDTLVDRILYNRTRYRVYLDFRDAAVKGAVAVINGNIPPINPMDEERAWVYLYNKIFFSLTIDGRDNYKGIGGDAVSHCNASHDLLGISAFEGAGVKQLYTLATLSVDYRGHRVLAQSIIPGIFHGDQASTHVYGSMDGNDRIKADPKFHALMKEAANKLHLKEHTVIDKKDNTVTIASCSETKGIIGSDRRHYVLDLTRYFPRDANFPNYKTHPTALLRPELVTHYCYNEAIKSIMEKRTAELKKEQERKKAADEKKDGDESKSGAGGEGVQAKGKKEEAGPSEGKKTTPAPGQIKVIKFNPDVFCDVKMADPEEEKNDKLTVVAASQFLSRALLPKLMTAFRSLQESPLDGTSLTDIMHKNGINVRYLGRMAGLAIKLQIPHIASLCTNEMIVRAAKHVLNSMLRDVKPDLHENQETWFLAPCIVRFLNTFLGPNCCGKGLSDDQLRAAGELLDVQDQEDRKGAKKQLPRGKSRGSKKKKSGKRGDDSTAVKLADGRKAPTNPLAPANLWIKIHRLVKKKFDVKLPLKSNSFTPRRKLCMLRSLCKKVGIQLSCKAYDFDSKDGLVFQIDDVLDLFPVVKTVELSSKDASACIDQAKLFMSQDRLQGAYQKLNDAQGILHQTYGPLHEQTALCYSLLALVCYRAADVPQAVEMQQKALIVYQRTKGMDHYETAYAHSMLALFLHSMGLSKHALNHIRKSLYLLELMCGPNHPDVASAHVNVGMIYQETNEVVTALAHFKRAKEIFSSVLGAKHSQIGLCEHTIAVANSFMGNFKEAMTCEIASQNLYKASFGEKSRRVQESKIWLAWFTKQASEVAKGLTKAKGGLMPIPPHLSPFVWLSLQKLTPTRGVSELVQLIQLSRLRAKQQLAAAAAAATDKTKTVANGVPQVSETNASVENSGAANPVNGNTTEMTKAQKRKLKRQKQKQKKAAAAAAAAAVTTAS
mmetsp:Transcript_6069/g.14642  ORF Transcript_6069/g.14642 Transcript_6069/m.14642 type:complete len:1331 (-) Transcript_6069:353-4345(-)